MLSFEIVGYAPCAPRDWYTSISRGRDTAEEAASQLIGGSPLFRGVRKAATLANQDLVGISVWEAVVLVVWSGVPATAFRWDHLVRDPRCQRFSVSVTPAANGMEARWEDANTQVLRHVVIENGELVTNVGDAHLIDDTADTDTTLQVNDDSRLPAKTVKELLASASKDDVKTYDGRRYVRTDDADLISRARIVHTDPERRTWVAIDQAGTINTLHDPLADLTGDLDPDNLAVRVVNAWFGIDMLDDEEGPQVTRYAWPDSPELQGLAAAIEAVQQDQQRFFTLLGSANYNDAAEQIAEHYGLHLRDAYDLLKEPLIHLLPHRAAAD